MKNVFSIITITTILFGCSTQNPSPNNSLNNSVTDIDGNIYHTVQICNQLWTAKNLDVSRYRNGDVIPEVNDSATWNHLTTGAWCYYNHDPAMGAIYGKLYNWYAVNDPRGLAPQGWHVSTEQDWNSLLSCLDPIATIFCYDCEPSEKVGKVLKSTSGWAPSSTGANCNGTDSTGFSALPGGLIEKGYYFPANGIKGLWWSSTESHSYPLKEAIFHRLSNILYSTDNSSWDGIYRATSGKQDGMSVRCVKD